MSEHLFGVSGMKDEIGEFIKDTLKIDETSNYRFRKIYGLTFVFEEIFLEINEKISSAEIKPVGIIFEENDEYLFSPLDEVDDIEPIIKEYVKNYFK